MIINRVAWIGCACVGVGGVSWDTIIRNTIKLSKVKSKKKVSSSSKWHLSKYVLFWLSTLVICWILYPSNHVLYYSTRADDTDSKTKQNKKDKSPSSSQQIIRTLKKNKTLFYLPWLRCVGWCNFFVNGRCGMCQVSKLMMMMWCDDVMWTYGMLWWVFWFLQIRNQIRWWLIPRQTRHRQYLYELKLLQSLFWIFLHGLALGQGDKIGSHYIYHQQPPTGTGAGAAPMGGYWEM